MVTITSIGYDPKFNKGRFPTLFERANQGTLTCAEVVRSEEALVSEFDKSFGRGIGIEAFEELLNLAAIRTGAGF